jgi:hypothetical protein
VELCHSLGTQGPDEHQDEDSHAIKNGTLKVAIRRSIARQRVLAAAGAGLAGAFCIVQVPNHQQ